ncbi:GGDEF domain-containing protein [Terasakiella sp. SH-1]|uniref:GGDEF domain-containing protein n=1 Tax=Terasakiella sp. SH-1 TaxID=2560057 RepID=UPI001073FB25|nr:GGDEF domain-containing protein [Terasakiella sp. SH-1]
MSAYTNPEKLPNGVFNPIKWLKANSDLFTPHRHSEHIQRHRSRIIASRVGFLSLLFAITVPFGIGLDLMAFAWPYWGLLALLRVSSAFFFFWLYRLAPTFSQMKNVYLLICGMFAIPLVFYLISHPFLLKMDHTHLGEILTGVYELTPYIIVAGMSIFPLAVVETLSVGGIVFLIVILEAIQQSSLDIEGFIKAIWLMVVFLGISLISGTSQLQYLISLVNDTLRDSLTGAYTRHSGEEFLDLQYRMAIRNETALVALFIDIDNFKPVNDKYGHARGDDVLKQFSEKLFHCLRRTDLLIRWGGEEFLLLLPNTPKDNLNVILDRIQEKEFGERPDGKPLTVSIGVAELHEDGCKDWMELVETADTRMYEAKRSGRNRIITMDASLNRIPFIQA